MYLPITSTLLSLLALTAAKQPAQKPLHGGPLPTTTTNPPNWLSRAKAYLPTAFPTVPGLTAIPHAHNPKPTAASPSSLPPTAAIAAKAITPLTRHNYRSFLTPDPTKRGPSEYMVFITGGNRTCGPLHCHNLHVTFNESAVILYADPLAPKLAVLDCDNERKLCATLGVKPPVIWHVRRPSRLPGGHLEGREEGESEVRVNYLNYTTTGVSDVVALHTGDKYLDGYLYEGWVQPFDSWLARNGLLDGVGWVVFVLGLVPSWGVMLTISMVTRGLIQRRAGNPADNRRRREAAANQGNAPQGGAPPANEKQD